MISGRAGGHDFKNGVCECGVHLADVQWVKVPDDVGKPGIAHSGTATTNEIEQLAALGQKMREQVNLVFGWRD